MGNADLYVLEFITLMNYTVIWIGGYMLVGGNRMLEVENLQLRLNGKPIINDLSLRVNKGEIHGILGENGCYCKRYSEVVGQKRCH